MASAWRSHRSIEWIKSKRFEAAIGLQQRRKVQTCAYFVRRGLKETQTMQQKSKKKQKQKKKKSKKSKKKKKINGASKETRVLKMKPTWAKQGDDRCALFPWELFMNSVVYAARLHRHSITVITDRAFTFACFRLNSRDVGRPCTTSLPAARARAQLISWWLWQFCDFSAPYSNATKLSPWYLRYFQVVRRACLLFKIAIRRACLLLKIAITTNSL